MSLKSIKLIYLFPEIQKKSFMQADIIVLLHLNIWNIPQVTLGYYFRAMGRFGLELFMSRILFRVSMSMVWSGACSSDIGPHILISSSSKWIFKRNELTTERENKSKKWSAFRGHSSRSSGEEKKSSFILLRFYSFSKQSCENWELEHNVTAITMEKSISFSVLRLLRCCPLK